MLINISGKELAGVYEKIPNVTFNECIVKCCETNHCNVVFMNKNDCYTVCFVDYDYIINKRMVVVNNMNFICSY